MGFSKACTLLDARLERLVGGAVWAASRGLNFGGPLKFHPLSWTPLVDVVSLSGGVVCEEKIGGLCCWIS